MHAMFWPPRAKNPVAHGSHGKSFCRASPCPGVHVQFVIETAPGALVFVLRGHCSHARFVFPVEKKPWAQNSHSPSSAVRRPRPAMHLQSLLLVDPGADISSAGQSVGSTEPCGQYACAGHCKHAVDTPSSTFATLSVRNLPAAHW
jgi:hypothetical protein